MAAGALLIGAWHPGGPPARLLEVDLARSGTGPAASGPREAAAPSSALALAAGPDGTIYTAEADGVAAWRREDGRLVPHGERWPSPGTLPCHLALTDGHVIVAHYDGGLLAVHPIGSDGTLGPVSDVVELRGGVPGSERQDAAHPHMVRPGPDREVIVTDLGADLLRRYRLEDGRLVATSVIAVPAGTGPRHLVVVDGVAYVAGELADTLVAVDLNTEQVLHVEACGRPDPDLPSYPSAVKVSADRQRCHVLRRGPDTIATFSLGRAPRLLGNTGCGGDWPWDLEVEGNTLYVANQHSGTVAVLRTDAATGLPTATGESIDAPGAVSLLLTDRAPR